MYQINKCIPNMQPHGSKGMITEDYIDFLNDSKSLIQEKYLEFEIISLKYKFSFKVSNNTKESYKIIGNKHFINIETGDIIILDINNPGFLLDASKFKQATQVDFDYYQSKMNKNNDNSKVYNIVQNIIQMDDSEEDDDDDPYFRGNIDDYLNK